MFDENSETKYNFYSGIYNMELLAKKKKNIPPSEPSQEQNIDGIIGQSSEKRV